MPGSFVSRRKPLAYSRARTAGRRPAQRPTTGSVPPTRPIQTEHPIHALIPLELAWRVPCKAEHEQPEAIGPNIVHGREYECHEKNEELDEPRRFRAQVHEK